MGGRFCCIFSCKCLYEKAQLKRVLIMFLDQVNSSTQSHIEQHMQLPQGNLANAAATFIIANQFDSMLSNAKVEKEPHVAASEIKINPLDLEKLVGMQLHRDAEGFCFYIDEHNSRGEVVGWAHFKPNEIVAWCWSPNSGFQVIATKSFLFKEYGKPDNHHPFQFSTLHINEKGVVAGSFLIDQLKGPGVGNRYSWFWWSSEEGIHLNPVPAIYQLVDDINNKGNILINVLTQGNELNCAYVVDIMNPEYLRYIEFPKKEIKEQVNETIQKLIKRNYFNQEIYKFEIKVTSIRAGTIDDNSLVSGEARIVVNFLHGRLQDHFNARFVAKFNEIENGSWMLDIKDFRG
jgi:hypothetical protein